LVEFLASEGSALLPLLGLLERAEVGVEGLIDELGTAALEAVLEMSAAQVAGPKHKGKEAGDIRWHGRQPGQVYLGDRKLKVPKPRLRRKAAGPGCTDRAKPEPGHLPGTGHGAEVPIPVYPLLQNPGPLSRRMLEILVLGVSTRRYQKVLPQMAQAVGMSKSAVSRQAKQASAQALQKLSERRFDDLDILIVYLDGLRFAGHHVLGAIGVDASGNKHVLGLRQGASENATVVKELLEDLVQRGIKPGRRRLFVIDGAKALRAGIDAVYGADNPVQRCRNHKRRNVLDHLPQELHGQVTSALAAAWKLDADQGPKKLEQLAQWLQREHPSAAESLREGLSEMFTINRLNLPPTLRRCLGTTNLIDSSHSGVREKTDRVTNWADGQMVLRWAAAAFLKTQENFRKIMGHQSLWMLKAHLDEARDAQAADATTGQKRKAG
jgi:transposase-like protein